MVFKSSTYAILLLLCFAQKSVVARFWAADKELSTLYVINVPVADMYTNTISKLVKGKGAHEAYGAMPYASDPLNLCVRGFQCLFNEIISDSVEEGEEIAGILHNVEYGFYESKKPRNRFYTLKKNIVSLDYLKKLGLNLDYIPVPLWSKKHQKPTIVLITPWQDVATKRVYSACTRFVHLPEFDTDLTFGAGCIDYSTNQDRILHISKSKAIEEKWRSRQAARELFVDVLKKWANRLHGYIPYVWGGASILQTFITDSSFIKTPQEDGVIYERKHQREIKSGIDCSALILRARQIAGIPSRARNTTMIDLTYNALKSFSKLQKGDIILVPGHVMVVSDIGNNLMIEAAGYMWGYGKVHEVELSKRFEGIKTYDELFVLFRDNMPVVMTGLNSSRKTYKWIKFFKLL